MRTLPDAVPLVAVLLGLAGAVAGHAQTLEPVLEGIDIYGTDRFDTADLRAAFPGLFEEFAELYAANDFERLEPMMESLKEWIDARRMPFRAAPDTELPDPDGVLALWGEYETKGTELMLSGALPSQNSGCPVLHCAFFFDHPELAPWLERLNAGAAAHRDELFRIAEESGNPEHRAQAIFLLAHAADAESLLPLLGRAIYDENSSVRNNAMRVMMYLAMTNPSLPYPIESLAAALPNLLKLLRSERPNIHDPAYETLKILSDRDFAERDYAAWEGWAAAL